MANTASNVSFGKPKATGAVYVAPSGTTLPTDATTALAVAYKSLGYVSQDGLVNEISTDVSDILAWGGDTVLSGQTSFKETFTFNMLETNVEALKTYYGAANVTDSGGGVFTVTQSSTPLPEVVLIFEIIMTGGRIKRIVVPHGKMADRSGTINYTDGDAIQYPALFTAFPDSSGNTHTEYIAVVASS